MTAVLSCDHLHAGYSEAEVLSDVRLDIAPADIYALIGKNGAGKTTFALTVLGVLCPSAGQLRLFGEDVAGWPPHRIASTGVAFAPQENAFFQDLTVDENLRLGSLSLSRQAFQQGRDRVVAMFPFIGERLRQKAGTLSGGEQAMVKVARALLPKPRFLVLDEVTEGLQPLIVNRVRDVLAREHSDRQITMLIIEQNVEFVASFATRYGLMDRGQMSGEGRFADQDALPRITKHLSI
ncbi:MAG: ATP-binding cassette domain-containing protein [Roseiarcus sp.]|jgi:branched-chain amino acid transport system ATP-binding protein